MIKSTILVLSFHALPQTISIVKMRSFWKKGSIGYCCITVIDLKQSIACASHRAEAALFEYIILIFAALVITLAILAIKPPIATINQLVYSCFLTSYEGKIVCTFPEKVHVEGQGDKLIVNNRTYKVVYAKGYCFSNKILFERGVIKCLT